MTGIGWGCHRCRKWNNPERMSCISCGAVKQTIRLFRSAFRRERNS